MSELSDLQAEAVARLRRTANIPDEVPDERIAKTLQAEWVALGIAVERFGRALTRDILSLLDRVRGTGRWR